MDVEQIREGSAGNPRGMNWEKKVIFGKII
jgi:hypothetical protein